MGLEQLCTFTTKDFEEERRGNMQHHVMWFLTHINCKLHCHFRGNHFPIIFLTTVSDKYEFILQFKSLGVVSV